MKFDCIIMNPPYQRNLHLKILAEALKHLKDEKSVCVNLSPDTWLNDFADFTKNSDYNEFKDKLNIVQFERIGLATDYFDLKKATYGLGIYVCEKNPDNAIDLSSELHCDIKLDEKTIMPKKLNNRIKQILVEFIQGHPDNSLRAHIKTGEVGLNTKWTRYIPRLVGNVRKRCSCISSNGMERWDKNFYQGKCNGKTYNETKKKLRNVKNYSSFDYVEFETEVEANNWRDSNDTCFMRYICTLLHYDAHLHSHWMPFLGSATNPRTGLVGYKGEWIDEDLFQFFGLTDDEKKVIEETMRKYK